MARNLQAKLPSTDTLRIYDINTESVERFAKETKALGSGAAVETASSVREAAEDSVGLPSSPTSDTCSARLHYVMSLFYQ
jgi:3-hydroxyisobutyrate dehydrogenase